MKEKGLLQSSFLMVTARILSAGGSFVLFWIISQNNVAQLGAFRTIFIFFLVCDFIPLLGMHQYIIREISLRPHQGREIFSSALLFTGLTGLFVISALVATALWGNYSQEVSSGLFIIALSIPATGIVLCCQSVLVAAGDGASFGLYQGGEVIIRTLISLIVFLVTPDILSIFYCFILVRWLSLLPYLKKIQPILSHGKWGYDLAFTREFLHQVPAFAGILLFFLCLRFSPQLMVPLMRGDVSAGYFAIIYQFLDLLLLIPTALTINLMPMLTSRAHHSIDELTATLMQTMKLMTALLLPTVLFVSIKAKPIIEFIFGPKYEPAEVLLSITIGAALIMTWDLIFSTAMIAAKKQKTDLLTLAISSGTMVLLLYPLILYYDIKGAAIAFMAGSTVLILTRFLLFSITISRFNPIRATWRYFLAGSGMAMVLFFTNQNLFLSIVMAIGFYGGILFLLGSLKQAEINDLLIIFKKEESSKVAI
ncbi:MAG: polysaccharide biosynthesis C-terminal domain-containing protein [Desulfocapsaceae bacterium]|nr:polysaccharide biosynthesis C-terminal domain-containing protein [Desulfocapsaceae bacterium]